MQSFKQFFLEYRHKLADGTDAPSIRGDNGRNPDRVGPNKKQLFTKGPYKSKFPGMDRKGAILMGSKLTQVLMDNGWSFKDGEVFQNFNNSGLNFRMYMGPNGPMGRVE